MAAAHLERLHEKHPDLLPRSAFADSLTKLPGDLTEVTVAQWEGLGHVDHIYAAWPCQGLSRASRKAKGLADKRSGLFWDAYRGLSTLRKANPA